jgi:hypothetical protein
MYRFHKKGRKFLSSLSNIFSRTVGMRVKCFLKVVASVGLGMPNFHYKQMPGQEFCGESATTTHSFVRLAI